MKQYAVFGNPVEHSFSPAYFKKKFENLGIQDCNYSGIRVDSPSQVIDKIRAIPLEGANVTIPFKKLILPLLDFVEQEAKLIGSVNCIVLADGKLHGHNTDHIGFIESLREQVELSKLSSALILGDGGSAAAVAYALKLHDIEYKIVSRSAQLNYYSLSASLLRQADLVVNTTPLGMHPNTDDCPDIPYEAIRPNQLFFDLIYRPEESLFLKRARLLNAKTMNGLRMLELQADHSWRIWNGG